MSSTAGRSPGLLMLGLRLLTLCVVAVLAGCGGQPVTVHLGALSVGTGVFQSGLPANLILPAGFNSTSVASQTSVVMTPQAGTEAPRTLTVTGVTSGSNGTFVLSVTIPTLTITAPATYLFTANGTTTLGSFDTSPGTPVLVQPGAQILSVSPAAGRAAQTLDVTISAISTAFVNGSTQAAFGPGISVNGSAAGAPGTVSVTNATTAVAHLVIDPAAATGARTVTVTTASQTVTLASAFTVTPLPLPPVASAGGPYTGTTGSPIAFTASSSTDPAGLALTYVWTFGDGGTATGIAPNHTYAAAGRYTATVVVTNSQGASSSATAAVTVTDPPRPPVASAGGPYTGTTGTAVTFTAAASTDPGSLALTYTWAFGDGGTATGISPAHTYATAGTYTVALTATNTAGLTNTASTTATISDPAQPPVANAGGPYTGVAGTAVTFSGAGSSDPKGKTLTYSWSFGDGATGTGISPAHTYAAAGTFTVSLTVRNTDNLTSTSTATAVIATAPQPPIANAGGPYTGVAGTAISFSGAGSSDPKAQTLTYSWSFGDGGTATGASPSHTYAAAGTYAVSLSVTNTDLLSSTATTTATVTAAPQAPSANAGGPYAGIAGSAVSFNGAGSADPRGELLTYAWTFGDGGTASGANPSHTYAAAGTYTVSLRVTNTDTLFSTATTTAVIAAAPQPPVANAGGPYTGTAGTALTFSGAGSSDPKGQTLTYAWSFGDGGTASVASPTHTYAAGGTYTVTLAVTNTDSLTSSSSTTAVIATAAQPPVANAGGPYAGTAGTALNFSAAASTDPKGETLTYVWNFGDGTTGTGVAPTHTYSAPGTFTVSLTVTNTDNLASTRTTTATIAAAPQVPVANAGGPYAGTVGVAVSFSGTGSSDPRGQTLTYAWSFGDGGTASVASPAHTYATAGTFTASLKVTNTDNLSASSTAVVTISPAPQPPVANAGGPYAGTAGTALNFSAAASTDPKGETLTYAWNFGDGTVGSGVTPAHTYSAPGTYNVSLTVTNTDSLTATASAVATIAAPAPQLPVAKVGGPYTGTTGVAISFSGTASTDPRSEPLTYAWTFGDGGAATGSAPTHTYTSAGTYTVVLTVTNTDNLTSTASTTATIATAAAQPPVANPGGPYAGVANTPVSFIGTSSSDPKGEPLTFAWTFGDGGSGSGPAPNHTYASAGSYTVSLTVTNTDSASATATTTAVITAAPTVAPVVSTGGPYSGKAAQALTFNGSRSTDPSAPAGSPFALTFAWSFGDGTSGSGPSPVHTYAAAGTYTVTLTVTTPSGGTASASTSATIAAADVTPGTAPTVNPNGPYAGTITSAINFSSAGTSDPNNAALTYVWSFGDGSIASGPSPTHTYSDPGTYSVVLTVNNGTNTVSAGTTATITGGAPAPKLTASAGGPYTGNVNRPIQFDATATTDPSGRQLTYLWDFGDGRTGGSSQPSHTYTASGSYTVSLSVTDGAGSSGNATTQVTVTGPAPESVTATAGGPYTDVVGHSLTFDASRSTDSLDNPLTYTWNFGDGTTGTGATPAHSYTSAGTYTATVTVISGTASATASAKASIATALNVVVTTPVANALFGTNTTTVTGTVSAPGLTVNVNGVAASVSGTSFTATGVSLREGVNLITATATDSAGGVGSGTVMVTLDATAPTVSITSPVNGTIVSSPSITVAGLVNDIVTGTIGSTDVTVSVNGVAASVANRSYSLNNLLLVPGSNTITVTATDNVGHTSTAKSSVQYTPPTTQLALVMLNGNAQTAAVHSVLPQPLVVQLRAADGTPVAGRPVTFTVTRSDGQVEVMPTVAQSLYVTTDTTGKASVLFQLGSRTGLGVNQVTASTPGASGTVLFTADSTSAVATQIHAVRGENQRGLLGEPLPESLQVIVTDSFANPIPGITVNYALVSGDGTLDHATAITDSNGKAVARLTLGQQEGIGNYSVSANFAASTQPPILFVSSGFAAGPVANTSVSGVVLDNSNTPIANATVRLLGTMLSTVTDTSGRFSISGAPVGTVTLSVDGSTSTSTHTFPFLSFVLQDLPGQDDTINKPIYLPFIDVDDAQTVGGDDPVTLTMRGVPGLAFTIAPHSVTFPDGSTVGKMSISQVKSDMVPMPPSNGTSPDLIWTLQPAGARFSVPVQVTLPNTQALPPGMVSEMYQYDHDLEQFVSAGTAHISADGSVIVSDPGFGITKAGWGHGPNTPAPPNCTQSCKPSNNCARWTQTANCQCIKTPINNGAACGSATVTSCINPGKCVNGNCNSGPKPNGTDCDDNRFCTEPDKCSAGICKGTPIADKPDPANIPAVDQISVQQNFSLITGSVASFLDNLHIPAQLQPTFQLNYNKGTLTCCQALQQKNVSIHENSFQAGLQLVAGPYPIIIGAVPLGVYIPGLGTQGVFGQAQVAFLGVYAHRVDSCKMSDCYLSGPQGSIQLSGGIGVNLGKWANANVALTGGLAADLTFGCGQATFKFYTLPIQVQGQVTLLTGTSVPVVNKILVPSYVIYQKTVPF